MPKLSSENSLFIHNAAQIVTPVPGLVRGPGLKTLRVQSGSIYIRDGLIQQIGTVEQVEKNISGQPRIIDATGKVVLPGFVDAHTHLLFGGRREDEFALRCAGASYEQIAKSGGGIAKTVYATREMSLDELVTIGMERLRRAVRHGITSIEIKSGYGLDKESELKLLRAAGELEKQSPLNIVSTFLGAHAILPGVDKDQYVQQVISMLPQAARLAEFCDVFCEQGYFSPDDTRLILTEAGKFGMKARLHTNQFHSIGGVQAAVDCHAVSVEHLECMTDKEIAVLAATDMYAVMLPGVSMFLNIDYAPGRKLLDAGCIPVLATDFNPGSSMTLSMPLMLTLACTQMGFSIEEAIAAATQNPALSLGMDKRGCLEPGWFGDVIILDTDNYKNLAYFFGEQHICQVVKNGQVIFDRDLSWSPLF